MSNIIALAIIFAGLLLFGRLCYKIGKTKGAEKAMDIIWESLEDDEDRRTYLYIVNKARIKLEKDFNEMEGEKR